MKKQPSNVISINERPEKKRLQERCEEDDFYSAFVDALRREGISWNYTTIAKSTVAFKDPCDSVIGSSILQISGRILPDSILTAISRIPDPDNVLRNALQLVAARIAAGARTDELYQAIYRKGASLESVQEVIDASPLNAVTLLQLIGRARKGEFSAIEKSMVQYTGGRRKGSTERATDYIRGLLEQYSKPADVMRQIYKELGTWKSPYEADDIDLGKVSDKETGKTLTPKQLQDKIYKIKNAKKKSSI